MKIKLTLIFFIAVFIVLAFPQAALADSFTLSGTVSDSSGNHIPNSVINATDTITGANAGNTQTDSSGAYSLVVVGGTYNVHVTPPAGSGFSSAVALSQKIFSSTVLNFVLTPAGTVTLSGHVYDKDGNPLPNQQIVLNGPNNSQTFATTGSDGSYSLQATAGTYVELDVRSKPNANLFLNAPYVYNISKGTFDLNQVTILDISLPAKRVNIHVQNSSGDPVGDVSITSPTLIPQPNLSIGGGINDADGYSYYNSSAVKTDPSGNITLWLFPSTSGRKYSLTATPSPGGGYAQTILSNLNITDDTNQTITLRGYPLYAPDH